MKMPSIKSISLTLAALGVIAAPFVFMSEAPAKGKAASTKSQVKPFEVGMIIPQTLPFETTDGIEMSLANVKAPTVLLHFWASWCGPCIAKFPDMLDDLRQHNGKIAVIAMSLDHDLDAMKRYIAKLDTKGVKIYWGIDYDFKMAYQTYKIKGTPETVFLDSNRKVTKVINNRFTWNTKKAQETLRSFIQSNS